MSSMTPDPILALLILAIFAYAIVILWRNSK